MNWKNKVLEVLRKSKDRVVELDLEKKSITYFKIQNKRDIKVISGDEEIVRGYLVNRLVNELDYNPQYIEIEVEYEIGRPSVKKARIDILVKDRKGKVFFFIEVKAPDKWENDKEFIEGQLFNLAKMQADSKYLVYYTVNFKGGQLVDQALVIDFQKYKEFDIWDKAGRPSIASELSAGYGKPRKPPLIKGDKIHDLRKNFTHEEINSLSRNLHNVLWGGGGTTDTEVFNSLVNIILAKIQDEDEKTRGEQYDFQVFRYEDSTGNVEIEKPEKVFERVNQLYRKALKQKLNILDEKKLIKTFVINEEKFPINKLVFTVQELETLSFLEGRSAVDNKDILGDFFEQITRDGFKQTKGQFFTPVNIVKFLLYGLELDNLAINRLNKDLVLPFVMDPACGSGTFLIEAMKMITKEIKYKNFYQVDSSNQVQRTYKRFFMPDEDENQWAREFLYGADQNFDLGTAAKVNMILHGDGSANLYVQDGLLPFTFYTKAAGSNVLEVHEPESAYGNKFVNEKFDIVISNPPFSVDLDTETKRSLERSFIFYRKKNSENLFIERYYQLLKKNGRLGVVLPESVYDTTENRYIRIFLFKYFKIKAVISLPQLTFEPFTSTKTSLLFAQKKSKSEVALWNKLWEQFGKEWSQLKTRVDNYIKVLVHGDKKEEYPSIKSDDNKTIRRNINRFLKDYIKPEDSDLPLTDLLKEYLTEIEEISSYDKDLSDIFGFVNLWWVFSEVSKEINYNIFMAEVENVGYKRTKRGPKPMPNDLFDIEYAPKKINTEAVLNEFERKVLEWEQLVEDAQKAVDSRQSKLKEKEIKGEKNSNGSRELEKEEVKLKNFKLAFEQAKGNKVFVETALKKYYESDALKAKYYDRTDQDLINLFTSGLLSAYKSEDVLLRQKIKLKILDHMRSEVRWE